MRRLFRLLAVAALVPALALAQGHHPEYSVLKPEQPVETDGKIEVIEFFWYGCPHCYQFEPLLEAWVPKLAADVKFRRVPAILNDRWARDAALFYAFEALGFTEKLHRPFFDAIHRDRLRSDDAHALAAWLRKNGVDPARVEQTAGSFGVQARVRRAKQLTLAYRVEGVPTLAIHGRYTVHAHDFAQMLRTADRLIAAVRQGTVPAKH